MSEKKHHIVATGIPLLDHSKFRGIDPSNKKYCTIEATVVTGFETVAKIECESKINAQVFPCRGRILFDCEIVEVSKVLQFRSVDSVRVVANFFPNIKFAGEKENDVEFFERFADEVYWDKTLAIWSNTKKFSGSIEPQLGFTPESIASTGVTFPNYRVTCHRTGTHSFGSPDAACAFGSSFFRKFGWCVKMKGFDIEILLNIEEDFIHVCVPLNHESLHCRNIKCFGPTTLRATICYNMLLLGCIRPGDIVCDPLCGSGSIPIEGSLTHEGYFLCGDNHEQAIENSKNNACHASEIANKSICLEVCCLDATHLPFRDNTVDVCITDLPFGKRMGSKYNNKFLYDKVLSEMARITRLMDGRAVILTQDKSNIIKTLQRLSKFWIVMRRLNVNIGGLSGLVHVLHRTSMSYPLK